MGEGADLALTLIASAPYRQMKQAEAEVALDPAAAAILEEFEQMQEVVRKAMAGRATSPRSARTSPSCSCA